MNEVLIKVIEKIMSMLLAGVDIKPREKHTVACRRRSYHILIAITAEQFTKKKRY